MDDIVKEIIKRSLSCYFVSPHLDDAAFSAGGLISYLSKKTDVTVVTVFTKSGKKEHSLSAKAYAKMCGFSADKMDMFFKLRRKEDREVYRELGVRSMHLGYYDALWRKGKDRSSVYKFLSLFLNDFKYIYPTHRLHISKGKISNNDMGNLKDLKNKLRKIIDKENSVVFCPIGLGNHVDHVFVRKACSEVFENVIFWEDSPYNLYNLQGRELLMNNYERHEFSKNQEVRRGLFPKYKTQFGKLFEGERAFKLLPETYYFNEINL